MRIIHDVESPMSTSGGGHPYNGAFGHQGYNGMRIELMACTDVPANHPELPSQIFDDEVIYIEGNSKYVRELLVSWLEHLDMMEDVYKKELGELRPAKCPDCQPDDVQPNVLHQIQCPMHTNHKLFYPDGVAAGMRYVEPEKRVLPQEDKA